MDTHTILWMINDYGKLSSTAKSMLLNDVNTLHISIASAWEIAIKVSLGKLIGLSGGAGTFLAKVKTMPINLLPIAPRYVEMVETLPFIHRDPFDRLLVATAKADGMIILTADKNIHKYNVQSVW